MAKAPELKMPKLPKSLGKCVDMYAEWRAKRLAEAKDVDAIKTVENGIREHIIQNLPKGDTGAVGTDYKAIASNDLIYQVEDWDKFYAHLKKTGEFDLLNRALNQAAVKERVDDQVRPSGKKGEGCGKKGEGWEPKLPPGVKKFVIVKLSVTKVK